MRNNRIKELRVERGWTQTELSQRSGVSRQTINYLEHNKVKSPLTVTLIAIAQALGTSLDSIFFC